MGGDLIASLGRAFVLVPVLCAGPMVTFFSKSPDKSDATVFWSRFLLETSEASEDCGGKCKLVSSEFFSAAAKTKPRSTIHDLFLLPVVATNFWRWTACFVLAVSASFLTLLACAIA
jgi:hypothetical protein